MTDFFGISSNIVSILGLIREIVRYTSDVQGASEEIQDLIRELQHVAEVIGDLKDKVEIMTRGTKTILQQSIAELEEQLNGICEIIGIQSADPTGSSINGTALATANNGLLQSLTWPHRKKEIAVKIAIIERLKTGIHTAFLGSIASSQQAIQHDLANLRRVPRAPVLLGTSLHMPLSGEHGEQFLESTEWERALRWLSPLQFYTKHTDIIQKRTAATGLWLLEHPVFKKWATGEDPQGTLLCSGIPGAGKSVLASIVIDHLQELDIDPELKAAVSLNTSNELLKKKAAVLYVYCNFLEQEQQTATILVSTLLRHLATSDYQKTGTDEIIRTEIMGFYRTFKAKDSRPSILDYSKMLQFLLPNLGKRAFIIVDAIDECSGRDRDILLAELKKLPARLFITSRPIPEVLHQFRNEAQLEVRATKEDIKAYLESQMRTRASLSVLKHRNPDLAKEIMSHIIEKADGMFLLANLHLESVAANAQRTDKDIRIALQSLPTDIRATYDVAMSRVKAQGESEHALARRVLIWITYAKRPLTLRELQFAISIATNLGEEIDEDALPSKENMVSVCVGLVIYEEESRQLQLVHHTTRDYLLSLEATGVLLPDPHADIAKLCIEYLLKTEGIPQRPEGELWQYDPQNPAYSDFPLLSYAADYWHIHTRHCSTEDLRSLVNTFLQNKSKIRRAISWGSALLPESGHFGISTWRSEDFVPLLVAAACGLVQAMDSLLNTDAQNPFKVLTSCGEVSALILAARYGHTEIVRMLLKRTGFVDHERPEGENSKASGHRPTSRLLQARRRLVTSMSKIKRRRLRKYLNHVETLDGYSALCFATRYKHIDIVQLLVQAGTNVNLTINYKLGGSVGHPYARYRLLHIAILGGCTELVKILLEHGAEYITKDDNTPTPLHQAAQCGKAEVVELLLGKCKGAAEFDSAATLKDDRTPLHQAVQYSRIEVVRLFLKKGAACDSRNTIFGITPLQTALKNTDFDMVKLLLEEGADHGIKEVDRNSTLLHKAAEHHKHEVVEILLERGVPYDTPDLHGYTPLMRTLKGLDSGAAEVARLLLLKGAEYDINKVPVGTTLFLLHRVAGWLDGGAEILQMLLENDIHANYTFQDQNRRTLLHYAAQRGNEGVVRILLDRGLKLGLDCQSNSGKTPLHEAAENGEEQIVQILLEGDVNPNIPDADGRTPLHVGLLGYERLIARSSWLDDRHNTAGLKFRRVVHLLVGKGANPDIADRFGNSARSFFSGLKLESRAYIEIMAIISQSASGSSLS